MNKQFKYINISNYLYNSIIKIPSFKIKSERFYLYFAVIRS